MKTLQEHIIEETGVTPTINPAQEVAERVFFLKEYLIDSNKDGYVLGISGGQDSTLVGKLCQMAVEELRNEGYSNKKFLAIRLPYGIQKDEDDAQTALGFIDPDETIDFNIKPMVDSFAETFNGLGEKLEDYHKGNVKARARMIAQYAYAGSQNMLVAGADHPGEYILGFFSLGGDGQSDILPLGGLSKRQGAEILEFLEIPKTISGKVPTADLLDENPGQTDETELGIAYSDIDDYLEGKSVSSESMKAIEDRYLKTAFKRNPPVNFIRA